MDEINQRDQEIWEADKKAGDLILALMRRYFGSVAVRQLTPDEVDNVYLLIEEHGRDIARIVDFHTGRERTRDAQVASVNVLRAVLAGQVVERRHLTGEEPSPGIQEFILGEGA